MPGVADAERRTRAKQEQKDRGKEREEILRLVSEDRLHEADERQLETIKLALELNRVLNNQQSQPAAVDTEALASAIREAMTDVVSKLPTVSNTPGDTPSGVSDPARPGMRHVDLTTIQHGDSGITISHDDTLTQDKESDEDAADKLRRLRELKGQK